MPSEQARALLNIPLGSGPLTRERIMTAFDSIYAANEPEKGGSFYIQSKVFNAKEVLLAILKAEERKASGGGAAGAGAPKKPASSTASETLR